MRKIYLLANNRNFLILLISCFFSLLISTDVLCQVQQTFNTTGSFTVPAGITKITVECWGGGGNGGSRTSNGKAGGGGGGAYSRKLVTVTPLTSYAVTVGAAGGDSWFNTAATVLAKGGLNVGTNITTGALGGSAASSIGDQTYSGGKGGDAGASYSGGGGASAYNGGNGNDASTTSITGGTAPFGGGAGADGLTSKNNGNAGNTPGGGGGGGFQNGTGGAAGPGAVGRVIISYYSLTSTAASTPCQNTAATITLSNSTTTILPVGTYTVTYNLSGANTATGNTTTINVSTAGSVSFSTPALSNSGSTTITITNLASGFYSSSIGAFNAATFNVTSQAQPTISAGGLTTFCQGGSVVLTASSSGATSYQWYSDGNVIGGATTSTYTATTSAGYTVVAFNSSTGCSSQPSTTTTVTVNSLPSIPTITPNGPTTFCADGSLTLTSTSATNYQWYKGGVLISGATSQAYSPTASGNYTVIVKNANGCSSSSSLAQSVTVNSLPPIPTITPGGPTTFCSGGNVVLNSSASSGNKWYDNNGLITGATLNTYTANAGSGYLVRVTDVNGCTSVSSVTNVTVNPLSDITLASQATGVCSSASSQNTPLIYTNTDNSPTTYSITWNSAATSAGFANVTNVTLLASPISVSVPANVAANTYTGNLTVTNANTCQSTSKSFTVTVKSSPNLSSFSVSAADGCAGSGALITINSTSLGNGVYTVIYDLTGANSSTNNSATMTFSGNSGTFTAQALSTGSTTVTVTAVSLVGCSTPVSTNNTANFTINALPSAPTISGLSSVCVDATITLTGSPSAGTWATSEPSIATVNSGVVTGLLNGVTTITYTTAPVNGCTNSNTQNVTVNALPVVQGISGQTSLCVANTSLLSDATSNGTWSSSNTSFVTIDNSGLVTAVAIGSAVITYTTPTDNNGCSNFTTVPVTVNPDPTVSAGSDINVCESSSPADITLAGSSYGGGATSAIWTIENAGGGSLSSQGSGNNPANIKYTPPANFYGTITLKITTNTVGTCGSASATRLINITQKPTASAGSAITVCQSASPSAIQLSTASVGGSANTGAWSIVSGGGVLSNENPVTDPANIFYTPAANFSGTITLRLTTDAIGVCGSTFADRTINVTALPTVDAGTQNSVCQSSSPGTFALAGATVGGGATTGAWSISLGSGILSSTSQTSNPAAITFQPTSNFSGQIKLTLTTNIPAGCSAISAERIIDVTPASTVLAGGPDQVCQSATPVALILSSSSVGGGATTGTWGIVSGGGILSSTNPETNPASVMYTPDISYSGSVSLLLTTNATGNCPAVNATRTITVLPNATITLTSLAATTSQTPCINTLITPITYTVGGGGAGATFSGLPTGVNGSYSSGTVTISGTPIVSGNFSYTVTTTAGSCTQTSAGGTINVSAVSVGGTVSSNQIICQNATPADFVLSGNTGSVVKWQKASDPNFMTTITDIASTSTTLTSATIGALSTTTYFRAVVQSGVCASTFSGVAYAAVNPPFTPTLTATPATICLGQSTTLATLGFNSADTIIGGDFSDPTAILNAGWAGTNGNASNNNTYINITWGYTNSGHDYGSPASTFSSSGASFMVVSGNVNSTLVTPAFSTVGRTSLALQWYQGYKFFGSATGTVDISINGGSTWTNLATYNSSSPSVSTNPFTSNAINSINLNSYLGQTNVKIRFNYTGSATGSTWALDNVNVVGPYQPVTYAWTGPGFSGSGSSVMVTPSSPGSISYSIQTTTGGCSPTTTTVSVTVNDSVKITAQPSTSPFCVGSNASINVNATGSSLAYTWQLSTTGIAGAYGTLTIAAPYSTSSTTTSATLSLTAPGILLSSNYYKLLITGTAACGSKTSNPIALKYSNVWMGATNTDWNTATNWSDGVLPPSNGCTTVYIPNRTNQPTLNTTPVPAITNLVIDPSAVLTVTNSTVTKMQIAGTITNSGTFDVTNGTVELSGNQSIPSNTFTTNYIKNLITSSNVSLTGPLALTGTLSFGTTSSTISSGGNLTLKSTASATAAVGPLTGTNSISGDVTVERYFSAKRAWRFLAVPTQTTQSFHSAWQENMPQGSATQTTPAGYGTQITDAITPNGTNGFDYFSPMGPSVKKYDPATSGYIGISSTLTAGGMATQEGWMTFVRGDRTASGLYASPTPATLRTKGPLKTGTQSVTLTAGQFKAIGNPYAAPLDMYQITPAQPFIYIWDPNLTGNGFGAFQTFLLSGGYYYPFPGGGSYPSSSFEYHYIQSGLGFFVQGGGGGTLTITENSKASSAAAGNALVFRPASPGSAVTQLRTNLYAVEANSSAALVDATLEQFDDTYSNKVDQMDAIKLKNLYENLSIKTDTQLLVIERRHTIDKADTIHLNMLKMKVKSYRFEFIGENFDPSLTGYLLDSNFKTRTHINLNGTSTYDFNIIDSFPSWNPARFSIVFAAGEGGALPITFTTVKAFQQDKNIAVSWIVENEKNIKQYEVEKSVDGQHFTPAISLNAKSNNSTNADYHWLDMNAFSGNNYYRIKSVGIDGSVKLSNVVKIVMGHGKSQILVFPNPLSDGNINLQMVNQPKGNYVLRLLNKLGQVLIIKQIEHEEGSSTETIKSKLQVHGAYQLEITKPDTTKTNIQLLY